MGIFSGGVNLENNIGNTLYLQREGSYVHMQNDTICVEQDSKIYFRMPLHNLDSVVVLGNVLVSQPLLSRLVELNIDVSFHHINGGFRYRITGPLNGNILLRLAQFEAYNDKSKATEITKRILASKIRNSRYVLSRGSRDVPDDSLSTELKDASEILGSMLGTLETMTDINSMRGLEGSAASVYFKVFDYLISSRCKDFSFNTRSRRPPRDRVNALLSFAYTIATSDCISACNSVGLDYQLGFLHVPRPGRPSLALDFVEEIRSVFADKLVLSLINLRQLSAEHFDEREIGGSVLLNEEGRKVFLRAYQSRKYDEITHPLFDKPIPFGLVPHVQARLMARHLRSEVPFYEPFIMK